MIWKWKKKVNHHLKLIVVYEMEEKSSIIKKYTYNEDNYL